MKYLIVLLLLIDPIKQLTKVAKINAVKKTAQEAYIAHDYKKAIENYSILLDSLEVEDDMVLLNLANAYHKVQDSANAQSHYEVLTSSENNNIQSIAQQQLGVIQFKDKKYETALTFFKRALRANPNNSNARYNYELTKKIIEKKKEKEEKEEKKDKNKDKDEKDKDNKKKDEQKKKEDQQKKDKEKKEQEEKDKKKGNKKDDKKQDKKDKKGEEKDDKEKKEKEEGKKKDEKKKGEKSDDKEKNEKEKMSQQTKENLEKIKISPQKAKMILEAMKNQEVQYLQQAKKRSKRKQKDNTKPDW